MTKAPIANPNSTAAPSGPSPWKPFGTGAGPESQSGGKSNGFDQDVSKTTPSLGTVKGTECPEQNQHPNGVV